MILHRPDWNEYFMKIAILISERSTCLRRHVGAIIVKEKRILATGYNGAPKSLKHCFEIGCLREKMKIPPGERQELCRGIHAEQNAIIQSAYHGVSIKGASIYTTDFPCIVCAKMCINAGIIKIYFKGEYPDELSQQILKEADIEILKIY